MRVAVLGGGPAAGSAAIRLAGRGVEATLFRPARGGEKPCGGALPSFLLDEIEGFDADSIPAVDVHSAVLENGALGQVRVDLSGLKIFRRVDLDTALVQAATDVGARLVEEKVRGIDVSDGSVVLESDSGRRSFDWLIAGDGARGLSRRTLGLQPCGDSVGLGASLSGPEVRELVLGFPDVGDAYSWIFPRPGGCSVGIAYTPGRLSKGAARATLDAFLARHLDGAYTGSPRRYYFYPIPVYGSWTRSAVHSGLRRRILLAGDAAAVADPLTREGIRHAMRSGRWAADAVLEGRPESYPAVLVARLGSELDRAARAADLFFDDPVGQWMIPVCRYHPGVRRVLGDLLACRQPYRGLRARLLRSVVGLRRRSDSPFEPAP